MSKNRLATALIEDVPFELCELANPRRWHKRTLRRPWKHRDRFHDAVDDVALEKHMKTRRNCNMAVLSKEQEDRIVSRIAARRNPGPRGRAAARRWWHHLSPQKRHSIARSVLGHMNPRRRNPEGAYRGCILRKTGEGVEIIWPDDTYTWVEDVQRAERVVDRFYRKHPRMVAALNPRRRGHRRNPKRDGTPTRGEIRAGKYVEHLRKIMVASENARLEYQRLTGTVAKAGAELQKPTGPRAMKHAIKELTHHTGQLTAPSPAAVVAEHPELRFLTSRLHDLDQTIDHFRAEIKELPKDDLSEDEEARLQEEIAKLARQKAKVREQMAALVPAATNPRRRGRTRRISSHAISLMRRSAERCSKALRILRSALSRHR